MNIQSSINPGIKRQSGCGGTIILLVFALFWSSLTCGFLGVVGYGMLRQTLALGYPSTPGTITEIDVKHHGGKNKSNELKLKYRYDVGGKEYTADRYRYGKISTSDRWADDFARQHPPGTAVPVYYYPYDPSDAVLLTGIEGMDLMMLVFLTPFTLVMLGIWWGCWATLKPQRADVAAAGLPVLDLGNVLTVRMPSISPLVVALGVLGASAFAMVFVLAFSVGMRPAMWIALLVWCVLLSAAMLAYVLAGKPRRQGRHDLTLDRIRRQVILPANLGRKDHAEIAVDQISGVGVSGPVYKGAKNSTPQYQVVLYVRNPGGSTDNYPVAEFSEEPLAESLAEFLRTEMARKL